MTDEVILAFEGVTIAATPPFDAGLESVSFSLKAGELMLVRTEPDGASLPLADAAEGLMEPDAGRVLFLGEDWKTTSPQSQSARRGRIGRVFEGRSWISNLDVDENITLAQRHHTPRPMEQIERDAEALVRRFGLAGLPRMRPALMKPADQRRAEWARAFLGEPLLVILEQPDRDVSGDAVGALVSAAAAARAQGAAVLWLTGDGRAWAQAAPAATQRFEMRGAGLVPRERE
jgi:phospholipid/cholesterol/gamma-HCH transport system ATP-binding protein